MAPSIRDLVDALDGLLVERPIRDYCPNGLQVDAGTAEVRKIVTGVTANLAFIERAAAAGADAIVVHHGIYWHGAPFTATGALGRRIRALMAADMSLIGYHLPLDAHPTLGNAATLADRLRLAPERRRRAFEHKGIDVGCIVDLDAPLTGEELLERLRTHVNPEARAFLHGPGAIRSLGIVTGGAARDVTTAAALGCDAFITGEAGEYSQADALEEGIHFFAGGHHRTERFGPIALTRWLAEQYPDLDVEFIDVDNPV